MKDIDPIFEKVTNERKKCYIMGDFNIDLLKDDSHKPTHEYLNLVYSYSFMPTIYKPTKIIDNILVNEVTGNSAILVTDISDHLPTVFVEKRGLKVKRNENKFLYKRNHSLDNINHLKQKLSNVNWHEELVDNNANDSYNKFINIFIKIYDECIPMKKYKSTNKTESRFPWISKGLPKSINTKNKLYKRYVQKPSEERLKGIVSDSNNIFL